MKLRITISKYHPCYLCQISLQIMLLPIQITFFEIELDKKRWALKRVLKSCISSQTWDCDVLGCKKPSLREQPFLHPPRRWRNVLSGEDRGETAVFAGHKEPCGKSFTSGAWSSRTNVNPNRKPDGKALVTWLLDVPGSRKMPTNLSLKVSIEFKFVF